MFGIGTAISTVLGLAKESFAYLNKKQDVGLEKYKIDGIVKTELIQADVEISKINSRRIVDQFVYLGFRICTYLVIFPTALWFACGMYDSTFRNLLPDYMTWRTLELPADMKIMAGAALTYILGVKVFGK